MEELEQEIIRDAINKVAEDTGPEEIDQIKHSERFILSDAQKLIEGLDQVPELLLIDGNRFKPIRTFLMSVL